MTLKLSRANGNLNLAQTFTWNQTVWNPSMISTALWLDAADTSTIIQSSNLVSQWSDKSGNARHGTQAGAARPTYNATGLNAKPTLIFDGSTTDLVLASVSALTSVNQSFVIIAQRNNAAGRTEISFGIGNKTTSDGIADIPRWTDNVMYSQVGYVSNRPSPTSVITNSPYINCVTGGSIQLSYTNGILLGTGTAQSSSPFSVADGGYIGSGRALSPSNRYFAGNISELVIIPSVVTNDIRQKLEGYLAWKWGLTANLPSNHPYKTVGPTP